MARSSSSTKASGQTIQVVQGDALERLVVALVSKLIVLAPPWVMLGVVMGLAAISHAKWGKAPAVTWATMASTLSTVALTGLTYVMSHHRGLLGRSLSTVTMAAAGGWFAVATITGVAAGFTLGAFFFGGVTIAVAWDVRAVIRQAGPGEGGGQDRMSLLFEQTKESFGLGGARFHTRRVTDKEVSGTLNLPPGEKTQEDALKKVAQIESGLELPPGSVNISPDEDDASRVHLSVTDPRRIKKPIMWPGPSRPGGSIAEPSRVGEFQDGRDVEPEITRNHLQIMGASGSGKSLGGTWNLAAEWITRKDVAIFGVDLAKDVQTFGPLRPALHGVALDKAKAHRFVRALNAEIPKRTKWLAQHGYGEWEPGCGLLFWVIVWEEIPKIFDRLGKRDQELIEQAAKEIRSAGGRIVTSLQRSTYAEMPTIVRSQMAFMCFGLNSGDDAPYGLSERQQLADASPQLWGAGRPEHVGKAFIDAAGIPDTHIAMPLRTYAWGRSTREAVRNMTEYAAQWPAAAKETDEFTARLVAACGDEPIPMPAVGGAESHAEPRAAVSGTQRPTPAVEAASGAESDVDPATAAERLANAVRLVASTQQATPDLLKRRLRIPYNDALRLLEALERRGVIGPQPVDGGPRAVLVAPEEADDEADEAEEDGDPVAEYVRTSDPSPEITAGPDDVIRDIEGDELETDDDGPVKRDPDAARERLHTWIRARHAGGLLRFTATDPEFRAMREETGMGRGWGYKALGRLADAGVLEREEGKAASFTIVSLAPLDDPSDDDDADDEA